MKRRLRKCDEGSAPKGLVRAGGWLRVVTVMVIEILTPMPSPPTLRTLPWRGWQRLFSPAAEGQPEESVGFLYQPYPVGHPLSWLLSCSPLPTGPFQSRMGEGQTWVGQGRHCGDLGAHGGLETRGRAKHVSGPQDLGTSMSVLCRGIAEGVYNCKQAPHVS